MGELDDHLGRAHEQAQARHIEGEAALARLVAIVEDAWPRLAASCLSDALVAPVARSEPGWFEAVRRQGRHVQVFAYIHPTPSAPFGETAMTGWGVLREGERVGLSFAEDLRPQPQPNRRSLRRRREHDPLDGLPVRKELGIPSFHAWPANLIPPTHKDVDFILNQIGNALQRGF